MFVTACLAQRRRAAVADAFRRVGSSAFVYSPAGLSVLRMLCGVPLLVLAARGRSRAWRTLSTLLILLDLADGMLARRINDARATRVQRRLDHLADAVLNVVAPASSVWLDPSLLSRERAYLLALFSAQAASTAACLLKFGCLPRYRTQAYRWMSGFTGVALALRVAGGRFGGVFRPALVLLAAAHIEALVITLTLDGFEQPIAGLFSLRGRHGAG